MITKTARLLIVNHRSKYCTEYGIYAGSFALVNQGGKLTQLGNLIKVSVVSLMPKAVSLDEDAPFESYDPDSREFKSVVERADKPGPVFYQYGVEALLNIGIIQAKFFMGTKTLRRDVPDQLTKSVGHKVILSTSALQFRQFQWFTVEVYVPAKRVASYVKPVEFNDDIYCDDYGNFQSKDDDD